MYATNTHLYTLYLAYRNLFGGKKSITYLNHPRKNPLIAFGQRLRAYIENVLDFFLSDSAEICAIVSCL